MSEQQNRAPSAAERAALAQDLREELADYVVSNRELLRRVDYAPIHRIARQLIEIGLDVAGDHAMAEILDLARFAKALAAKMPKNNVFDLSDEAEGPDAVEGEQEFVSST